MDLGTTIRNRHEQRIRAALEAIYDNDALNGISEVSVLAGAASLILSDIDEEMSHDARKLRKMKR